MPVSEKDKPISDLVNNLLWSSLHGLELSRLCLTITLDLAGDRGRIRGASVHQRWCSCSAVLSTIAFQVACLLQVWLSGALFCLSLQLSRGGTARGTRPYTSCGADALSTGC